MKQKIRKIVNKIKKNKEVIAIMLFGSYAKGKITPLSDIDLCVMLDKKYNNCSMAKKRMGYLTGTADKFDIQVFQLLPLYVKNKILKEGKILYSKNIKKIYDVAYETIRKYEDFKPRYEDYIKRATR